MSSSNSSLSVSTSSAVTAASGASVSANTPFAKYTRQNQLASGGSSRQGPIKPTKPYHLPESYFGGSSGNGGIATPESASRPYLQSPPGGSSNYPFKPRRSPDSRGSPEHGSSPASPLFNNRGADRLKKHKQPVIASGIKRSGSLDTIVPDVYLSGQWFKSDPYAAYENAQGIFVADKFTETRDIHIRSSSLSGLQKMPKSDGRKKSGRSSSKYNPGASSSSSPLFYLATAPSSAAASASNSGATLLGPHYIQHQQYPYRPLGSNLVAPNGYSSLANSYYPPALGVGSTTGSSTTLGGGSRPVGIPGAGGSGRPSSYATSLSHRSANSSGGYSQYRLSSPATSSYYPGASHLVIAPHPPPPPPRLGSSVEEASKELESLEQRSASFSKKHLTAAIPDGHKAPPPVFDQQTAHQLSVETKNADTQTPITTRKQSESNSASANASRSNSAIGNSSGDRLSATIISYSTGEDYISNSSGVTSSTLSPPPKLCYSNLFSSSAATADPSATTLSPSSSNLPSGAAAAGLPTFSPSSSSGSTGGACVGGGNPMWATLSHSGASSGAGLSSSTSSSISSHLLTSSSGPLTTGGTTEQPQSSAAASSTSVASDLPPAAPTTVSAAAVNCQDEIVKSEITSKLHQHSSSSSFPSTGSLSYATKTLEKSLSEEKEVEDCESAGKKYDSGFDEAAATAIMGVDGIDYIGDKPLIKKVQSSEDLMEFEVENEREEPDGAESDPESISTVEDRQPPPEISYHLLPDKMRILTLGAGGAIKVPHHANGKSSGAGRHVDYQPSGKRLKLIPSDHSAFRPPSRGSLFGQYKNQLQAGGASSVGQAAQFQ